MGIVSVSATATATATAAIQLFQSQQPLLRGVFPATRGSGEGGAFSISARTQICFPQQRISCLEVKSAESSSTVHELHYFRVKAVLTMFLKKEIGLSNEATAGTISKSVPFIDHLITRLHSIHRTRYLVGRNLTTLEIRDTLIPYLEYLCEENQHSLDDVMENFHNPPAEKREDHRDSLDDVVENFPNPPEEEQKCHISAASPTNLPLDSKKFEAMAQVAEIGTDGQLPPNTLSYLIDIGLDLDQIKQMACKCPSMTRPSWGRKIKPLVEFLLDIGMPRSNIPKILYKQPWLSDMSLSENIIPSLAFFETLGLDKSKWAKVIYRCPDLLIHSRQKVEATIDYLCDLGLPSNKIGDVLIRFPQIMNYDIDDLRLKAEYFQSVGVNLTPLLSQYPEVFARSIEHQLKPVTEFFLDKGFSIDEIGTIASRNGFIYNRSVTKNLIPKWDFFLTMGYSRSDLVQNNYFGYSLEWRIKPRYAQMKKCGVKLSMSRFLSTPDSDFLESLNRMKMMKVFEAQQDSLAAYNY